VAKTSRSRSAARGGTRGAPAGASSRPAGAGSGTGTTGSRNDATGASRHGRRERARPVERSFFERFRIPILGAAVVAAVVVVSGFVLASAATPAYACSAQFQPPASADPSNTGALEEDMGRTHVPVGQAVTYPLCPPASGNHYFASGEGPIAARLYGPNDATIPQGWVHNLEHGALVVLYRCTAASDSGCSDSSQAAMQAFVQSFPASPVCGIPAGQIGPVITRFDQMPKPYAALVWGRVLYLDSFDTKAILSFYEQEGERTNPEPQCASPSPATSGSPAASPGATAASPGASASPSTEPSASPAASPSPS
jgi:Protein of unknown function (DUF3105)